MLDPLTSLGLAANIVQLVQFGCKILSTGYKISTTGTTPERDHLEQLSDEVSAICRELDAQHDLRTKLKELEEAAKKRRDNVTWTRPPSEDVLPEWNYSEDKASSDASINEPTTKGAIEEEENARGLAHKTRDAAEELSSMLAKLDVKGKNEDESRPTKRRKVSTGKVIRSVWDGIIHGSKLEAMKTRLLELQQCMVLQLSAAQSVSVSAMVKTLADLSQKCDRESAARIDMYHKLLKRLEKIESLDTGTRSTSKFIANTSKHLHNSLVCHQVLKTLVFSELHSRENTIAAAHSKTFMWLYDRETTGFSDWASSQNGIFWITGKPGSGKSTLMKYIVQQAETRDLLRQWAGKEDLVIAHHYFWNAGTSMQKSQLGLLQTLVLHIVRQSPQWAVECLPERFLNPDYPERVHWTLNELHHTIRAFGKMREGAVKFCFFIDGLDEYVGDSVSLIDLVSSLASSPRIKVCVSSRPWNIFTRAYHDRTDGQLEVQALTRYDIRIYVNDKMNADDRFVKLREKDEASCLQLVDGITAKANGVFLWVYLVVQSLLRGLTNDDSLKILQRRLESYPNTLDEYFQRMFDRVENVYRVESSRLLLAAMAAEKILPFWAPRCFELEVDTPDYALNVNIPPSPKDAAFVYGCDCVEKLKIARGQRQATGPIACGAEATADEDDVMHNCYYLFGEDNKFTKDQKAKLRTYLDARCADLLEISGEGITFVHRTARDFLAQSDSLPVNLNELAGADYDVFVSLARLEVVGFKRRAATQEACATSMAVREFLDLQKRIRSSSRSLFDGLLIEVGMSHYTTPERDNNDISVERMDQKYQRRNGNVPRRASTVVRQTKSDTKLWVT